jgi:hypothetical protein
MKNMSKKKLKTSEPFGSALWPDLLRYRTFAVVHYGCMSDALHIQPQDACNFQVTIFTDYLKVTTFHLFSFGKTNHPFLWKQFCQKVFPWKFHLFIFEKI